MDIGTLKQFFFLCAVVNYALLMVWFLLFVYARAAVRDLHRRWFRLSDKRFDALMYAGMMIFKLMIWTFAVAPYIALCLLSRGL